jgi:hypothetical protein
VGLELIEISFIVLKQFGRPVSNVAGDIVALLDEFVGELLVGRWDVEPVSEEVAAGLDCSCQEDQVRGHCDVVVAQLLDAGGGGGIAAIPEELRGLGVGALVGLVKGCVLDCRQQEGLD